jgi:hypothetical protein
MHLQLAVGDRGDGRVVPLLLLLDHAELVLLVLGPVADLGVFERVFGKVESFGRRFDLAVDLCDNLVQCVVLHLRGLKHRGVVVLQGQKLFLVRLGEHVEIGAFRRVEVVHREHRVRGEVFVWPFKLVRVIEFFVDGLCSRHRLGFGRFIWRPPRTGHGEWSARDEGKLPSSCCNLVLAFALQRCLPADLEQGAT